MSTLITDETVFFFYYTYITKNLLLGPRGVLLNSLARRNTVSPSYSQRTTLSSLSLSPIPSTSTRPLDEIPECEGPETDLKIIETPSVFEDETSYSVVWLTKMF